MNSSLFSDLKILDLSSVLAGPSVASYFAELGAQVIKLEHPIHGDVTRSWRLPIEKNSDQISSYFSAVNYGKTYQSFDFADKNSRDRLKLMVENSDVILSNFKKGDDEKFGLEDKDLLSWKDDLILAKISGFGQESDRVAYDLILQAETGFMSLNGDETGMPTKMPIALIDVLAAHHLKEGILIALLQKERTGKGSILEVSLYDAALSSLMNQASAYLMHGHVGRRMGSKHPNIAPYGELFSTKDKQLVTFAIGSHRHFELLCEVLDLAYIAQMDEFSSNAQRVIHRDKLFIVLQEKVQKLESDALLKKLHQRYVPCAVVKNLDAVLTDAAAQFLILEEEINGQLTKRIRSTIVKWK